MTNVPSYLVSGGETDQNNMVAGILADSLDYGAELVNFLFKEEGVDLSENAELMAVQSPISSRSIRELDWVFNDPEGQLVGFESKKGSAFGEDQLIEEVKELQRVSSEGQERLLIVLTDATRKPQEVTEAKQRLAEENHSVDLHWTHWHDIESRLSNLPADEIQPQHEPLSTQLHRALTDEGYGPQFESLSELGPNFVEKFKNQQDNLVGLIQDLERLAPEIGLSRYSEGTSEIFTKGGRKSLSALSESYHPIAPEDIIIPFVPEGFSSFPGGEYNDDAAFACVHVNIYEPTVRVGAHLCPDRTEGHRKAIIENSETIEQIAQEYDLTLYGLWWSMGVENIHSFDEDITSLLSDDIQLGEGYRRIILGKEVVCDHPDAVKEVRDALEMVKEFSWDGKRNIFYPNYEKE